MTRKANNESEFTEFGLWLKKPKPIDSGVGYIASNIDYMWRNYKTGKWMLIEEKRKCCEPARWQIGMFEVLDRAARSDANYCGFYLLRFENTNPMDGKTWIKRLGASKEYEAGPDDVLRFLSFKTWSPPRGGLSAEDKDAIINSRFN